MRIPFCTVVLSGLLLAASVLRAQDVQILMTGQFHHKIEVISCNEWYGLFNEGGQFRLIKTTLKIEAVQDEYLDDKEGEKNGTQVSCDKPGKPLFLVRGIEGLEERVVETRYSGKKFIFPGEAMYFDQGHNSITLIAFGDIQKPEPRWSPGYRNYSLQFRKGIQQEYHLLAEYPKLAAFDEIPYLIWVGDLDNDSSLDMFWDLTGHYAMRQYTLFLSSIAKDGELLAKTAEFKIYID